GEKDERNGAPLALESIEQREAVETGENGLADDEVRRVAADDFQRCGTVSRDLRDIALIGEPQREKVPGASIAVDDEDAALSHRATLAPRGPNHRLGRERVDVAEHRE